MGAGSSERQNASAIGISAPCPHLWGRGLGVGAREPHRSLPPSSTSGGFLDPMGASDFDPAAFRAQAQFSQTALVRRFPGLCFSRVTSVPRIPANHINCGAYSISRGTPVRLFSVEMPLRTTAADRSCRSAGGAASGWRTGVGRVSRLHPQANECRRPGRGFRKEVDSPAELHSSTLPTNCIESRNVYESPVRGACTR